jgi:hypothetical protein
MDECTAFFLKRFSFFLNGRIVVAAEELFEIPRYLFHIRSFPACDIFFDVKKKGTKKNSPLLKRGVYTVFNGKR